MEDALLFILYPDFKKVITSRYGSRKSDSIYSILWKLGINCDINIRKRVMLSMKYDIECKHINENTRVCIP